MSTLKSIKSGLIFGISTAVKLVAGLFIVKLVSAKLGASGLGQLGQLMSVMGIVALLAGGGIFTGVIKYVAEFRDKPEQLKAYLRAGSLIVSLSSLVFALVLILSAAKVSVFLLGSAQYSSVIFGLALIQFFVAANNFAFSIINGYQDVTGFALVNIIGSSISVVLMYFLVTSIGLKGAMYGVILAPAVMSLISIPYGCFRGYICKHMLWPEFDKDKINKLMGYSGMLCVTAVTLPVAQIIVRKIIVAQYGWTSVGYWQGVSRISDAYLQFVTVVLANYYLPELASAKGIAELKARVSAGFKVAVPATIMISMLVYLCRGLVLKMLFPPSFAPMEKFFLFQTVGDCLKICAQTIGYVAVAKALKGAYIGLEIFQAAAFVGLSWVCLRLVGPIGVTLAYAITFFLQLLVVLALYALYVSRESRYCAVER